MFLVHENLYKQMGSEISGKGKTILKQQSREGPFVRHLSDLVTGKNS